MYTFHCIHVNQVSNKKNKSISTVTYKKMKTQVRNMGYIRMRCCNLYVHYEPLFIFLFYFVCYGVHNVTSLERYTVRPYMHTRMRKVLCIGINPDICIGLHTHLLFTYDYISTEKVKLTLNTTFKMSPQNKRKCIKYAITLPANRYKKKSKTECRDYPPHAINTSSTQDVQCIDRRLLTMQL
jgi:hypothetical protein